MAYKCILVGMDGANPVFIERMVKEGKLPAFQRMLKEGTYAPHCLSAVPTSTPENWTTIATGAWNGTHQVMSFQTFQLPELHGRWMAGYTSKECKAEFIWDAVERAGKECILIKYPASWPPTMKKGVHVCGCHVRPCAHQIDGAHYFSTVEPRNSELRLEPSGEKRSGLPVLKGALNFEARGIGGETIGDGLDERSQLYGVPDSEKKEKPRGVNLKTPVCKLVPPGKRFHLQVYSSDGKAYNRVVISRDSKSRDVIADLALAEWSDWICEPFETIDGVREGTLRFKLEKLSPDASVAGIYASQIMDIDHYTMPRAAGRELYRAVGPFITDIGWEGLGHDLKRAWFGTDVMEELADYQHQWLVGALKHLCSTRDWALCMLQAHCIDCANHHALALIDPAYGAPTELRERYLGFIERLYQSLDRMLGHILNWVDDETVVMVISDHGGLPGHRRVDTAKVLEQSGLLTRKDSSIDWSRTKAYLQHGIFININLEGREPEGIVPPEDYEKVCDEVMAALHAYVDERNGLHPYNLVLRKKDARYLGLYGDPTNKKIGDLVFTFKEQFGGTHGEQLSTAQRDISSNGSIFIMHGPNIRDGLVLERTVWLTDITPTICHILGVPPPRDSEGAILHQAFKRSG